jgi:putative glycosyltransferase (TIGR04372 family)
MRFNSKFKFHYIISVPTGILLAITIKLISFFYHIEILGVQATRVGHLAIEPEVAHLHFHKIHKHRACIWFYFKREEGEFFANNFLIEKWSELLNIGPQWMLEIIDRLQKLIPALSTKSVSKEVINSDYRVLDEYPPLINLLESEIQDGRALLQNLGIGVNDKYICLAVRDESYLKFRFPNKNFSYHDYRDSDISDYYSMAEFLISQGYFVVRMGRLNGPMPKKNNPKIIDYANSKFTSDFADVYLFQNCDFVISTSTGMDRIGLLFRKKIGLVNLPLPWEGEFLGDLLKLVMYKDVFYNDGTGRVPLKKLTSIDFSINNLGIKDLEKSGMTYQNNSPIELKNFASELIRILQNQDSMVEINKVSEDKFLCLGTARFDYRLRSFRISPSWLSERT